MRSWTPIRYDSSTTTSGTRSRSLARDWKPPAFLALHTPELIRAGGPAKQVLAFLEHEDQVEKWFAELAGRGSAVSISFRFIERIAAVDVDDVVAFKE